RHARVDQHSTMPDSLVVRAVVDEHPRGDADLIRRETDTGCGVHGLEHVGDQLAELVVEIGYGGGRFVQHGFARDNDGMDSHVLILSEGYRRESWTRRVVLPR